MWLKCGSLFILWLMYIRMLHVFELARDDRMRGYAFNLAVSRCHSEMKRRFLSVRFVRV
jgi:hypothetical protein